MKNHTFLILVAIIFIFVLSLPVIMLSIDNNQQIVAMKAQLVLKDQHIKILNQRLQLCMSNKSNWDWHNGCRKIPPAAVFILALWLQIVKISYRYSNLCGNFTIIYFRVMFIHSIYFLYTFYLYSISFLPIFYPHFSLTTTILSIVFTTHLTLITPPSYFPIECSIPLRTLCTNRYNYFPIECSIPNIVLYYGRNYHVV